MTSCDVRQLEDNVKSWMEHRFHVDDDSVTYKGEGKITPSSLTLLSQVSTKISRVDLSHSDPGHDLRFLEALSSLTTLVLDNCHLTDELIVPSVASLTILSLNKNKLRDLDGLLRGLNIRLPHLEYLSLIGNPLSPHPASKNVMTNKLAKSYEEYSRFRLYVVFRLPKSLKYLDDRPVNDEDRALKDSRNPGSDHRPQAETLGGIPERKLQATDDDNVDLLRQRVAITLNRVNFLKDLKKRCQTSYIKMRRLRQSDNDSPSDEGSSPFQSFHMYV